MFHHEVELQTASDESQIALIKTYLYLGKKYSFNSRIQGARGGGRTVLVDAGGDVKALVLDNVLTLLHTQGAETVRGTDSEIGRNFLFVSSLDRSRVS